MYMFVRQIVYNTFSYAFYLFFSLLAVNARLVPSVDDYVWYSTRCFVCAHTRACACMHACAFAGV